MAPPKKSAKPAAAASPAAADSAPAAAAPAGPPGEPLTQAAFDKSVDALGADAATVWALAETLSGGVGFLADRSPTIYFDPIQFNRETGGRFPEFVGSPAKRGSNGAPGSAQHGRLAEASALDPVGAIRATRWGLFQLQGNAFTRAGYESPEAFVEGMRQSEDDQLQAFVAYLRRRQLDVALRVRDWPGIARELAGPDYREDEFDRRLAGAYHKFAYGFLPDIAVRSAQLMLRFLGYDPGPVDGTLSFWTRGAIGAFTAAETGRASFTCDRKLLTLLQEKAKAE